MDVDVLHDHPQSCNLLLGVRSWRFPDLGSCGNITLAPVLSKVLNSPAWWGRAFIFFRTLGHRQAYEHIRIYGAIRYVVLFAIMWNHEERSLYLTCFMKC